MRTAILVLVIIGVVMSFGVGSCTGVFMSGVGDMATHFGDSQTGSEANEMGASMFFWALFQAAIGLIGGIIAFKSFDVKKKARMAGILLLIAVALSIHNIFQFFTSGLLFLIPAIMVLVSGGKSEARRTPSSILQPEGPVKLEVGS